MSAPVVMADLTPGTRVRDTSGHTGTIHVVGGDTVIHWDCRCCSFSADQVTPEGLVSPSDLEILSGGGP